MVTITQERAARTIQNAWRAHRAQQLCSELNEACVQVMCTRFKRRAPRMGEMVTVIVRNVRVRVDMGRFLEKVLRECA